MRVSHIRIIKQVRLSVKNIRMYQLTFIISYNMRRVTIYPMLRQTATSNGSYSPILYTTRDGIFFINSK